MYKITASNDEEGIYWSGQYSDALTAVHDFDLFDDHGGAEVYRTINLTEPNGKMHTKIFYRDGRVRGK